MNIESQAGISRIKNANYVFFETMKEVPQTKSTLLQ
jgi:hypothetical protein